MSYRTVLLKELGKWKNDIYTCDRCGFCRATVDVENGTYKVCPPYELYGFESYSARGKMNIALSLLEGRLKYSKGLVDRLYQCLLCGNCKQQCPYGLNIMEITKAMRQDIVKAGLQPDALKKLDFNVEKTHNVIGKDPAERTKWAVDLDLPSKGNVLYWAGCLPSYNFPDTARAVVAILRESGMNVAYLGEDEWCCGDPVIAGGSIVLAENLIRHNVNKIIASGAKQVITSCAGCFHTLNSEYPKIVGQLPFEVFHITRTIADLLEDDKIEFSRDIEKKVTYHDPCYLGRYEGIFDEPRKVIGSIPGIRLVEMLRNRENSWCCGGGTIAHVAYPYQADKITRMRVNEAKNISAEAIITACPLCVKSLYRPAMKAGIEVYDFAVVVAEAMGLRI